MVALITGSDGSLGEALMHSFPDGVGIPMHLMGFKDDIECIIDELIETHDKIDTVINNHGINHLSLIGETAESDKQILIQNTLMPYWVINHLVKKHQICRVVNIASATYRVPQRCTALYCASKAALVHLTKVMARELAPKGWVINALAPGLIEDTKMAKLTGEQVMALRNWSEGEMDQYALSLIPMRRYTDKEEVVDAIRKILELPDYINGTCIDMMGGC